MIRASNNDCECRNGSLQTRGDTHSAARNRREQHDMHHVRSPVSEKRSNAPKRCPPADNDIHIGRQRHPHRPMRMDRGKQKSPRESRREASNKQLFFVPAKAGLFERPKAAFFTVAADGVMPRMTVGMVETTRRKTRFPTGVTDRHTQAKPTAITTVFCVLVSPCLLLMIVIFAAVPQMFPLR